MRPILVFTLVLAAAAAASAAPPQTEPASFVNAIIVSAPAARAPAPATAAPPSAAAAPLDNNNNNTFDVVIVGAGIAGIAAALRLTSAATAAANSPPPSVVILEGRDRPGGRLRASSAVPTLDAGAMWIHGARDEGNPLPALAKRHGLRMSPLQDYNSGAIFASDGSRANLLPLATAAAGWHRSFLPALRAVKQRGGEATADESIWDVYEQWTGSSSGGSGGGGSNESSIASSSSSSSSSAAVLAAARLRLASNVETLLNADARNLSAARYGDSKVVPADDVVLADGFEALVRAMLASADPPLDVRYGAAVEAIEQPPQAADGDGAAGLVTVSVRGGGGDESVFLARRVIVTVPLGVLKASVPDGGMSASSPVPTATAAWGAERIPAGAPGPIAFTPPLPPAKVRAIRDFGYGRFEKVILDYGGAAREDDQQAKTTSNLTSLEVERAPPTSSRPPPPDSVFWDAARDFISRESPVGWSSPDAFPPFSVFLNYWKTTERPVLVSLNAGSTAERAAAAGGGTPQAVAAAADAAIGRLYPGKKNAPRPALARYDVTDWAGDPFSRGSYSYFAVGNGREIAAELARPFFQVSFAGEHTSSDAPATVHGALLSGEREAGLVQAALVG